MRKYKSLEEFGNAFKNGELPNVKETEQQKRARINENLKNAFPTGISVWEGVRRGLVKTTSEG